MKNLNKNLVMLNSKELKDINGGGFWSDLGKWWGKLVAVCPYQGNPYDTQTPGNPHTYMPNM